MGLKLSFLNAFHGLAQTVKLERNARIHLVLAALALIWGILLNFSALELAVVILVIAGVFAAELFNTVVEKTLDLVSSHHDPRIGLIKDMAAGAVLVTSAAALLVGLLLYGPALLGALWVK